MQRPDGAARALAVLRKPSVGAELIYKYASPVVAQATDEAVDFLVAKGPALDPARLLPALARFGEPGAAPAKRGAALRYVRFALDLLRCTDGTVHNLAVALLSLDPDEGPLLDYLSRAGRDPLGRPLYDAKYALRLARDRDRPRACVKLLSQLGLHQDAVALALEQVDLDLAKAVAENGPAEDDEQLRRKLWLDIARRVVQDGGGEGDQAEHIAAVMGLLREAGGLLRIEDVLPLFPDFVTIDAFKAAIVDSLQRYSAQIDALKHEMDEATQIAGAARRAAP
ncbi:Vacuolar protein sorting-associated protein 18 [Monoraphidium neglectum]|uniref:Vacuolar protein sorting-associated protein 18 n=1 Tax=Monoraphidium neglectum TaxID=145388 RepID=A0A0D2KF78_9CHLO|nr:Vacuolar protein sorting-associated protein 18 [Monoraphidium neglectum]KIY94538.1 Vacuolar protein sorting-associated protein 18 [Monoraphidium neglectum]|eukprot:XP_013893558.1 Vacuolar protein sorting-associated protein 18 [Monoraphidium neglectum]